MQLFQTFIAVSVLVLCLSAPVRGADLPATQTTLDLVRAAAAGDLNRVVGLLQAGADPNVVDPRWNAPLTFAALAGDLRMADALVRAGAVVDWQDGYKVTPLMLAADGGHGQVAAYLLASGADPWFIDAWGRRALDYALKRGKNDPIAVMLRRAEVNWPKSRDGTPVRKARQR
ncbi:MAG: ankyrin repeat domain-containing protein [Rhodospirillaceae bacterium]